uniref:MAM domain-containing protein n=1 Tax=Ascaris lumbricoides TaxID=6252 RepID=A0A9J2PX89_ASCLU
MLVACSHFCSVLERLTGISASSREKDLQIARNLFSGPHFSELLQIRLLVLRIYVALPHLLSRGRKAAEVALGLFVTTTELPLWNASAVDESSSFNCTFDTACHWLSVGGTADHWKLAKGEPDQLLWLTATGTTQLPKEPFALIEVRGQAADQLSSDLIHCQDVSTTLSFTYWAIGEADLEICLTDPEGRKLNCTGMLHAQTMPGKVSLKIPPMERPFRVSISANTGNGLIALDDIKYGPLGCTQQYIESPETTSVADLVFPWTETSVLSSTEISSTTPTSSSTRPLKAISESQSNTAGSTAGPPFDLLIIGNKTQPLFDRRRGRILSDVSKLLCDFNNEFPCLWGADSGRWALIQKGAIPSMESSQRVLPTFPAAVVLQGDAVFASDPLKCQTGTGKLLFRHWSNGPTSIQVCAMLYGLNNAKIDCVMPSPQEHSQDDATLLMFDLLKNIDEPFTLNIIPQWEPSSRNRYLVIDEIAYIGKCDTDKTSMVTSIVENKSTMDPPIITAATQSSLTSTTFAHTPSTDIATHLPPHIPWPIASPLGSYLSAQRRKYTVIRTMSPAVRTNVIGSNTHYPRIHRLITTKFPKRVAASHTTKAIDYCPLLNCNFEENACNYLNHGLTTAPWTLRNRGYGYPLKKSNDIRQSTTSGQFVSAVLSSQEFAILESPKLDATQRAIVFSFQFFRPSFSVAFRFCVSTRHSVPYLTSAQFTRCPLILRASSATASSVQKWNTIRVQLPPGTTQFFLVAHNMDRSVERLAVGIDNIQVAACKAHIDRVENQENFNVIE